MAYNTTDAHKQGSTFLIATYVGSDIFAAS